MLKNTLVQCDRSHNKQQLIYISLFLMKNKYTLDEQLNRSTCYALCFACEVHILLKETLFLFSDLH